jgi:hypothetical protein
VCGGDGDGWWWWWGVCVVFGWLGTTTALPAQLLCHSKHSEDPLLSSEHGRLCRAGMRWRVRVAGERMRRGQQTRGTQAVTTHDEARSPQALLHARGCTYATLDTVTNAVRGWERGRGGEGRGTHFSRGQAT